MEWSEPGIVLATRRHGEADIILEAMTLGHGRHLGLVKGGRSRRQRPALQPGNTLELTWRARLNEHLGNFRAEPVVERAGAIMADRAGTYLIQALAAHLRLLPERDPHPVLHRALTALLEGAVSGGFDARAMAEGMVRFEMLLLEEMGVGLDLGSCAATGVAEDLVYVSPKSGRAVSREAGMAYHNRLLPLPAFLRAGNDVRPDRAELGEGFHLTGLFLERHVFAPRDLSLPEMRGAFIRAVLTR
ncbi:DNA repair protein RecO [Afifella sp. IM 167]|uniref:DNA repair protein RecO n=1 Tax=Afifella sp. IM 167 TaxID=2033586 RepID=UPI001CCA4575|nr:DNA repair protein RecO [Afifella sp. IM 167]MBZ8131878.1 DNA repair protein RecO [Afifella sp. IM 167]